MGIIVLLGSHLVLELSDKRADVLRKVFLSKQRFDSSLIDGRELDAEGLFLLQ
jgi:hypothetical protein